VFARAVQYGVREEDDAGGGAEDDVGVPEVEPLLCHDNGSIAGAPGTAMLLRVSGSSSGYPPNCPSILFSAEGIGLVVGHACPAS